MATTVEIEQKKVLDFISVDSEAGRVSITLFHGAIRTGSPGWANQMVMSAEQAKALGLDLIRRADTIMGIPF